jgi:hypothetical protein
MTPVRLSAISALAACFLLSIGAFAAAPDEKTQEMQETSDPEVAAEYKSEATALRQKAESHRKLAHHYTARSGKVNYAQVAKHCDKLAQLYEEAAKEAEAVSSELKK